MTRLRGTGVSGSASWYSQLTEEEKRAENRSRGARQANQALRHYVRSHNLTCLLTLTNGADGGGFGTHHEAIRVGMSWLKEQSILPHNLVLVAEQGKGNGRWHLHAAIERTGWISYSDLIRSWSTHLEGLGYHSPTGLHRLHVGDENGKHKNGFASARVCANYLCKYISKDFSSTLLNQKRYRTLGTPPAPTERIIGHSLSEALRLVADTFLPQEMTPFTLPDGTFGGCWFEASG